MNESVMFDFPRFYDWIASEMPDNCVVVEVGNADGHSALHLAARLRQAGKKFKLYMVDNLDYGKYNQLNTIWRNVHNSGLADFIEIIPHDSVTASEKFNGDSLDFCFLDASHEYQETKDSILAWEPKLKDGGIFAGHDYDLYKGVRDAVNEVVPTHVTRQPLFDENGDLSQAFPQMQVLTLEKTERDCGLFYFKKDFFIQLNK